jgi:coenzyme F420 hydrogenase subunit delta
MTASIDGLPDYCTKQALVLGCGNVLFGDDGFGPAVVEYMLECRDAPGNVCFINAGSSVREILFNVALSERKPERIIVVDAMMCGRTAGTVAELELDAIPKKKRDDFSMHQVPTSNLLKELRDLCGIEVKLVVLEPPEIPPEVKPGLSRAAGKAVKRAAELVLEMCHLAAPSSRTVRRSAGLAKQGDRHVTAVP